MEFISYAQNYEDVMLWRALRGIGVGFYIDVGANDPTVDSVTKAFYDRGWSGINIEPLPSHHSELEEFRPRDINLCCAAGRTEGALQIWDCDVRGWASASAEVIARHQLNGFSGRFCNVPMFALSQICNKYVQGDIHFMKIDVEGCEAEVLEGMDFSRFRPWILVVEATRPNSDEECHHVWEPFVVGHGCKPCYADGLNRWYVACEHAGLFASFSYPPNVFDKFVRYDFFRAQARAAAVQSELHKIKSSKMWNARVRTVSVVKKLLARMSSFLPVLGRTTRDRLSVEPLCLL